MKGELREREKYIERKILRGRKEREQEIREKQENTRRKSLMRGKKV